jgi:hypothetical protein
VTAIRNAFVPMCLLAGAMTLLTAGCGEPEVAKADVE